MDVRRKSCEVAGREVRKVQLTIGTERDGGDWTEGDRQGRHAVRRPIRTARYRRLSRMTPARSTTRTRLPSAR